MGKAGASRLAERARAVPRRAQPMGANSVSVITDDYSSQSPSPGSNSNGNSRGNVSHPPLPVCVQEMVNKLTDSRQTRTAARRSCDAYYSMLLMMSKAGGSQHVATACLKNILKGILKKHVEKTGGDEREASGYHQTAFGQW